MIVSVIFRLNVVSKQGAVIETNLYTTNNHFINDTKNIYCLSSRSVMKVHTTSNVVFTPSLARAKFPRDPALQPPPCWQADPWDS